MDRDNFEYLQGRPWFVDLSLETNRETNMLDGSLEWNGKPTRIGRFKPADPRPPAKGQPKPIFITKNGETRALPGIRMDASGRFFDRNSTEIRLVGLNLMLKGEDIARKVEPMIPAPADPRFPKGLHKDWFIDALPIWKDNLPQDTEWLSNYRPM